MSIAMELERQHLVEQFIYGEVRLLDERKWSDWEGLFTEDGTYWAPATHDQPDPVNHVSVIFDDHLLRKVRLKRYDHPNAFSLQPFPRTAHAVSNVMIDTWDEAEVVVSAVFQMHEFRRDMPQIFAGYYRYALAPAEAGFAIRQKKATLVNCEGVLNSSALYF